MAERSAQRGRVAFVYPRATLDSVPAVCNAIDLLSERGFATDVFLCDRPGTEWPVFRSGRVTLTSLGPEPGSGVPSLPRRALARVPGLRTLAAPERAPVFPGLAEAAEVVGRHQAAGGRYACLIGVDPDGLDLAERLAAPHGIPLAYYSLELLLSHEMGPSASAEQRRLKERERALTQSAAFSVLQDEQRARLFADDNGVPWERVSLVPNAPLGPARRSPSDLWRRRFTALPPGARIALHAGSLGDWTGIEDIVASVPAWPEPWVLVIHTRYDAGSTRYVERLRAAADPRRVLFSLNPVPRAEYDALIDGADAGIAFYVPTGESTFTQSNIQTIGLSSGKVSYYLRAGLPVVVNQATTIGRLVDEAAVGVSVPDARGVAAALGRIDADIEGYSRRARTFFDQHLDFGRAFDDVLQRVERLATSAAALTDLKTKEPVSEANG